LSYILKVSELWKLGQFSSPCDPYKQFAAEKVGGACSHFGAIGPKVSGALAPLTLWLPRPCAERGVLIKKRK